MRDTKPGHAVAALAGLSTEVDESQLKVLERMAESFPHSLDAMRPPGRATTALPKRGLSASGGLAARTAGAASIGMRTGPSRGAAQAMVSRSLTAVESRLVTILAQEDSGATEWPQVRVELALLMRLRRGLNGQASQASQTGHDVVLADSIVEFAETVPVVIADLEAGGKRRLRRLLEHTRELLTQLIALGGAGTEHKTQLQRLRTQMDRIADTDSAERLRPITVEALNLYKNITAELERRSPRQRTSIIDSVIRG